MNYIEQFMKDNDIEIDEEFYVVNKNGGRIKKHEESRFYFGTSLFLFKKQSALSYDDLLCGLLLGNLKIEKIPQKPKTVWDLKEKDEYYFINIWGDVEIAKIRISTYSTYKEIVELGNAFLTKEEAEHEVERRKCEAILLKYGTRNMMSLGDIDVSKYYIYYDHHINELVIQFRNRLNYQGTIYFETEELAQKAIEECGEDRLKKYVFNVKE